MTANALKIDDTTYKSVTEMTGDEISAEQLQRLCSRYYWAGSYAEGKDAIEVACGAGAGLGYLASVAWSVQACDISDEVLANPRAHYGTRIRLDTADAAKLPYADASTDVLILFEAIYYLPDVDAFLNEAKRVLRPEGTLLIATANKDLYDFNPSPMSHTYFGTVELKAILEKHGFGIIEMCGDTPVKSVSLRQKLLRPIKKIVVQMGLMPKTTGGKKWMKRLVFGSLVPMPHEITSTTCPKITPDAISPNVPCQSHKVIFCAAKKPA